MFKRYSISMVSECRYYMGSIRIFAVCGQRGWRAKGMGEEGKWQHGMSLVLGNL